MWRLVQFQKLLIQSSNIIKLISKPIFSYMYQYVHLIVDEYLTML